MADDATYEDLYNAVETATVAALKSDSWLADTSNVKMIHEKLNRQEGTPTYRQNQVPAIGVYCMGQGPDQQDTLGERGIPLRVILDIVEYSGNDRLADEKVKRIMARARRFLARDMIVGKYPDATELDGFASGGDILIDGDVDFDIFQTKSGWIAQGVTEFTVYVLEDN